jgi:hypothetical protein
MDLNKHIVQNDDGKSPYHSHGYAKVANGERFGATSTVSFEQRLKMEQSRQTVDGYHRSNIGRSYGVLRAKSIGVDKLDRSKISTRPTKQEFNSRPVSGPRRFTEPSAPRYNPYA